MPDVSQNTAVSYASWGLQLREPDDGDGRTLEGIVVPYGERTDLAPEPESFARGSLTRSLAERGARIKLFRSHDHTNAIGQAVAWEPDRPEGCWGQFRLFSHAADLMEQVREGALDGFSVGFKTRRSRRDAHGVVNVLEAALHEVSLVPLGAYDGARVLATRSAFAAPAMVNFGPMPVVDLTPIGPMRNLLA